jgi:hypothetical protein
MNLKGHIVMAAALAGSALTFVGTAAGQDAHERSAGSTLTFVGTASGRDAHERATPVQAASTGALVAYVDGPQRSGPLVGTPGEPIVASDDGGFDWGSAMVGASSALVLALLIGVSLVTVRRFRAGPLAH